jgi:N-acetylglucosamine malate deacetylase 1
MRVMVFSPHPDDDLIGCGGSIAKHLKNGNEVTVVYLTSGDSGGLDYSKKELMKIREKEAKSALSCIGVKNFIFLRNPDGYLEYNEDNVVEITKLIRDKKPNIVYIPHREDAHKDHQTTNILVTEAVGRASAPCFQECGNKPWSVSKVLGYEVWTPLASFQYIEDISEFIELKIKALSRHKSQVKAVKYDEAVRSLNKYRGLMFGGSEYCEVFQVLKVDKIF